MTARLQYVKVVDREIFLARGARVHPGLHNEVVLLDEPGIAGAFLVMRAWHEDHGTFTEQWRIETPGGKVVFAGTPREIHLATKAHTEKIEDEVAELMLDYAAEDYSVVFTLDDRDVSRVTFPVRVADQAGGGPER